MSQEPGRERPPRVVTRRRRGDAGWEAGRKIEELSAAYSGQVNVVGRQGAWYVQQAGTGRRVALVNNEPDARFIAEAPGLIRSLVAEVKALVDDLALERQSDRDGRMRSALQTIRDELEAADSMGLASRDGQRRVRAALSEAREWRHF